MPAHEIDMQMPAQTVKNSDVTITVWADGATLGKLMISKGSVDWIPGHAVKRHYKLTWEKFADLMREHGTDLG